MCPLRSQCVAGSSGLGRTVQLHPARALQHSEGFAEYRQRRVVVEHRLARLVQLGIRQSRYFGRIKTRFQLYLAATVANLTLVAGKAGLPADTGGGSSVGSALRTGTIRSALEIVPARLGQILTPALLAVGLTAGIHLPEQGFPARFLGQWPRVLTLRLNQISRGRPILYGQSDLSSSQPGLM